MDVAGEIYGSETEKAGSVTEYTHVIRKEMDRLLFLLEHNRGPHLDPLQWVESRHERQ